MRIKSVLWEEPWFGQQKWGLGLSGPRSAGHQPVPIQVWGVPPEAPSGHPLFVLDVQSEVWQVAKGRAERRR